MPFLNEGQRAWVRGEQDLAGGFFQGLFGKDLGPDAVKKRAFTHGMGSFARFGLEGGVTLAKFGLEGGWAGTKMAWSNVPYLGSRWRTASNLRNASWALTSADNIGGRTLDYTTKSRGSYLMPEANARISQAFEAHHGRPMTQADLRGVRKRYGYKVEAGAKGAHAQRGFFGRSSMEHLKAGGRSWWKNAATSRLSWGITSAFAIGLSKDNILDPHGGVTENLASLIGSEVGFFAGSSAGAAIGLALGGGPGAAIGWVVGMVAGVIAGGEIGTIPWKLAELGHKYGRHSRPWRTRFQDSKEAATMRQRALQSVHRSQMNARSAFGSEALALHG